MALWLSFPHDELAALYTVIVSGKIIHFEPIIPC
jgi:hypothetical protein